MTDIPTTTSGQGPKPTTPKLRNPSAKTLARSLAAYLKANNIKGDVTVSALMDSLKSSIVEDEVGMSLDGWET